MTVRIQLRRDIAANWVSSNPTLRAGEIGIETDTLKFKVGTGSTPWNSITAYANVVPADLNTTLNGYLETTDLSDTVAELVDGNLYVPGTSVIFEGTDDIHELTLTAPDVTADRTITLPNATTTLVGTDTTDTLTNKTLTSPTITGTGAIAGTFTGNLTGNVSGNAGTVTNGVYTNAANTITAASASTKPLIIKGAASQTANLQEWQDSNSTVVASIDVYGQIVTPTTIYTNGIQNNNGYWSFNNNGVGIITARTSTHIPLTIKGAASQTANLQQWQDSSGTNLLKLYPNGKLIFGPGSSSPVFATSIYFDQATTSTDTPDGITWNFVTTNTSSAQVMAVRTAASYATDLYFTTANAADQIATERMRISSTGNVKINGFLSSAVGLVIRGAASQTANLQEWQDSAGSVKALIGSGGNGVFNGLRSGSGSTTGAINAYTTAAQIGILVRGAASQTANLQEWQRPDGSVTLRVDYDAVLRGYTSDIVNYGQFTIYNYSASLVGLTVRGATSQTANLQEWQDSSGTVLASINNTGQIFSNNGIVVNGTIYGINGTSAPTLNFNSSSILLRTRSAALNGLIVQGSASQTADLQQWQNSAGSILARITSAGALELQNALNVISNGQVSYALSVGGIGAYTGNAMLAISTQNGSSSSIGILVRGVSGQTGNLTEWQDSSGTAWLSVGAPSTDGLGTFTPLQFSSNGIGRIKWGNNTVWGIGTISGQTNIMYPYAANRTALIIQGLSSQTANLQQWQNSSGTVLAKVDKDGLFSNTYGAQLSTANVAGVAGVSLSVGGQSGALANTVLKNSSEATYDFLQFQNSTGAVLAKIDATGAMFTTTAAVGTNTTQVATTEFVQTEIISKSDKITTINAQSTSYTLTTSDSDKLVEMSGGGTLTISDSSSFPVGFTCNILQTGSSQVTIAGSGFTPNATPGLKLRAQWSSATLVKRALNTWVVMGDLSA